MRNQSRILPRTASTYIVIVGMWLRYITTGISPAHAGFENKKGEYMPILAERQVEWENCVKINGDPYGKACVDVARRVMELLDEYNEATTLDPHALICKADDEIETGGITGFMAGCVAQMVSRCHSRGEEFRRSWNLDNQVRDEGQKANESGGVLNPAILIIEDKK